MPDGRPTPTLYAYALFERAFGQSLVETAVVDEGVAAAALEATSGGGGGGGGGYGSVEAYGSVFAGGERGLVVLNLDASPRDVTLRLPGGGGGARANGWLLASNNTTSPTEGFGVAWNGAVDPPLPLDASLPPYALAADDDGAISFALPAFAAAGVVVYS